MNYFAMPPEATYHGAGLTRRAASLERICIPTFLEFSADSVPSKFTSVLIAFKSRRIFCDMKGMLPMLPIFTCKVDVNIFWDLHWKVASEPSVVVV